MFKNRSPFSYNMYKTLPLQVWLNNINNTNNMNCPNLYDDYLSKQDIIKHIKNYLDMNNINYNYFAKSIYKSIANNCNTCNVNNLDVEILDYLNKYYMNNQEFLVNNILDLINVNQSYDLYDLSKLNGIEKLMVKNFANDILKIMNDKHKLKPKSDDNLEKRVNTLESNITILIDEINSINNNNSILQNEINFLDSNYVKLKGDFNVLNNNYQNLKNEINDLNCIINEIMGENHDNSKEEANDNDNENHQNIDFVIKDVERIGDDVANELYKIMN